MIVRMFLPALMLIGASVAAAQVTTTTAVDEEASPEQYVAAIEAVAPSLVRVEYTLKYDKGEKPKSRRWGVANLVSEERPLEFVGFLVGPRKVVAADVMIHPRFVKDIAVRFGDQLATAKVVAYGAEHKAVILELDQPLAGAEPLAFDTEKPTPYLMISYRLRDGSWTVTAKAISLSVGAADTGRKFVPAHSNGLVVDEEGTPVALSMTGALSVDDSWKASLEGWPWISTGEMAELLAGVEKQADSGLVRVSLSFRSPRKGTSAARRSRYSSDDEENATERNVIGVVVDEETVLVLANLKPKVTARLERIVLHPPTGEPVPAKFSCTLADYGALIVKPASPIQGALTLAGGNILETRNALLMAAEIALQGEKKVCYYDHARIRSFDVGWKRRVYPEIWGDESKLFLFDADGALVMFPLSRRMKVSASRHSNDSPMMMPAAYVARVLGDLAGNVDSSNVPLTEADENRLAWMGVVLTPLNRELARMNKVSDMTNDGRTGGLVSFVYSGSPADKAGIKTGMILLRLHVDGEPKPFDVTAEERNWAFPWDRLGNIPVEAFENAPTPWRPAENILTRKLTEFGFEKKYVADFAEEGKVIKKEFAIVQSPPHYGSAPRYKSETLGLTVRDMTYEVRRYFLKEPKAPGVIVSKVEPGGKAAVAGIKPYEIITDVNGQTVSNAGEFAERLKTDGDELRFSVSRMTKGRQVKIKMESAATQPAESQPADAAADSADDS